MSCSVRYIPARRLSLASFISGVIVSGALWLFLTDGLSWAQGHSIRGNRVIVESRDHWGEWTVPKGLVEITDDGLVRPLPVRRDINASLGADLFGGGIKAAGSNPDHAPNIIDGDPTTFWGPDIHDPLEDWWVDIDLGRLVFATRIKLRFAEESIGDPFLKFKVSTSSGRESLGRLDWREVYKSESPNKDVRVFEFELVPQSGSSEGVLGDLIQYIRIIALDSDFDKGHSVSPEDYESLDPDFRGRIEHFRIAATGREELISREGYEELSPQERGPIRYYRWEVPRLCEVEVWALGDNISLGTLRRGGSVSYRHHKGVPVGNIIDGLILTEVLVYPLNPAKGDMGPVVDLGGVFWIDTVVIASASVISVSSLLTGESDYRLKVSDGSLVSDGEPFWEVLVPAKHFRFYISGHLDYIVYRFPLRKIRFLNFQYMPPDERNVATIGEFQVYGCGYPPQVTLTSPFIKLGEARSLTTISWDADTPSGTKVEIQTRTGQVLREVKHYFDSSGREVTQMRYNKLPGFARGEIKSEFLPGGGWSPWSRPYEKPGDLITSPSPRRYLQIQVRLKSDSPYIFPSLGSVGVSFFSPLAKEVRGELWPSHIDRAGVACDFSLFIRPTFVSWNAGFDEVLVSSPLGTEMELLGVRVGSEDEFSSGTAHYLSPREVEVVGTQPDSLWVVLSEPVEPGRSDILEIRFTTTVFLNGTPFDAFIANSVFPDSWQRVDPGDATTLAESQGMNVWTPVGERIIGDVSILPNPFTPNGDGVNDEAFINFSVFKINVGKPVYVLIYTIDGRRVRSIRELRALASGRYSIIWSGEDDSGRTVPPGIYLARIFIEADSDSAEHTTVTEPIYVVY